MFEKNPWKLKRLVPQLRLHEEKLASSAGWRQIFECIEIEDNDQVNKTMNGAEPQNPIHAVGSSSFRLATTYTIVGAGSGQIYFPLYPFCLNFGISSLAICQDKSRAYSG